VDALKAWDGKEWVSTLDKGYKRASEGSYQGLLGNMEEPWRVVKESSRFLRHRVDLLRWLYENPDGW